MRTDMKRSAYRVGIRGCCGDTTCEGKLRKCDQPWIVIRDGKQYCHYHDPKNPHQFDEQSKPA